MRAGGEENKFKNSSMDTVDFLMAAKECKGDSGVSSYPLPDWVNPELIKKGQEFVRHNFFAVFFAHFISLIFLLCYEPVRVVLVKTQKSDSQNKALKRYLSTLVHVKQWYEGNLLELKEKSAQDVYRIRKVHSGVVRGLQRRNQKNEEKSQNVQSDSLCSIPPLEYQQKQQQQYNLYSSNNDDNNNNYVDDTGHKTGTKGNIQNKSEIVLISEDHKLPDKDANIIRAIQGDMNASQSQESTINNKDNEVNFTSTTNIISQLDMAVTQFCFMGFMALFPSRFGIRGTLASESEVNDKEKQPNSSVSVVNDTQQNELKGFVHLWALIGFLLGIDDEFNICLEQNSQFRPIILHQVLLPDLKKCHPDTVILWKSLASGISDLVPCISLHAVLLFVMKNVLNFTSTDRVSSLLSYYENMCFKLMSWCFNSWIASNLVRSILNSLLRLAIFLAWKNHFPNSEASTGGNSPMFHI